MAALFSGVTYGFAWKDSSFISATGRSPCYAGVVSAVCAQRSAVIGGIWRPSLDKDDEYESPFALL